MSTMKHDMDQNGKLSAPISKETTNEQHPEKQSSEGKRSKKKGGRWTAIDTVILFLVLVALAGVVVRSFVFPNGKDTHTVAEGPYYVEFTVREIHAEVLEEFNVSDRFYLYETNELVGFLGYYADGTRALQAVAPVAEEDDRLVTAEGCLYCPDGKMENGSLLLTETGTYLAPGAVLKLRTDRATMTIEIKKIRSEA